MINFIKKYLDIKIERELELNSIKEYPQLYILKINNKEENSFYHISKVDLDKGIMTIFKNRMITILDDGDCELIDIPFSTKDYIGNKTLFKKYFTIERATMEQRYNRQRHLLKVL